MEPPLALWTRHGGPLVTPRWGWSYRRADSSQMTCLGTLSGFGTIFGVQGRGEGEGLCQCCHIRGSCAFRDVNLPLAHMLEKNSHNEREEACSRKPESILKGGIPRLLSLKERPPRRSRQNFHSRGLNSPNCSMPHVWEPNVIGSCCPRGCYEIALMAKHMLGLMAL